ncbi:MAG: PQQ-binding-like beta-propeller repeat protein [Haloferacaceae archaeon]
MSPTRRDLLRRTTVGSLALGGCLGFGGGGTECTEGRTVHERDAALRPDAAWPMFGYDAANTGANPDATGPVDGVTTRWRYSACAEADSGVAVADGRACAGGLVVDGRTGERAGGEWQAHQRTPAVGGGRLYVGTHDLVARDAATGAVQWTFETAADAGAISAPTVVDGTVYVAGVLRDSTLYAVDAASGEERWRVGTAGTPGPGAPAVADGRAYVVDESGAVTAVATADGSERWQVTPDPGGWAVAPVVADGRVYVAGDGVVLALDAADGTERWRRDVGHGVRPPVAVAGGTVYAAGRDGRVTALDGDEGTERWGADVDGVGLASPTVAGGSDTVYVGAGGEGGEDGALYALDGDDGAVHWRFDTRSVLFGDYTRAGLATGPAVVDDLLYVATAPGDLYALG